MVGAIQFITHPGHSPFTVVPVVNLSTPIYDFYHHQVPQFNNNYHTLKSPTFSSLNYPHLQFQQHLDSIILPKGNLDSMKTPLDSKYGPKFLQRREDNYHHRNNQKINKSSFNRRDGYDYGPGWGGDKSVGKSPAISALALLGFLFFLNLIQTSLQNNRKMLTTTTTITTNTSTSNSMTTGTTGSSSTVVGRSGRVRRKRGSDYQKHRNIPGSIPTHPNRQIEHFLHQKDDIVPPGYQLWPRHNLLKLNSLEKMRLESPSRIGTIGNHQQKQNKITDSFFNKIKRACIGCIQLAACNVGRSLYSQMGPGTGFMMRMLREQLLPTKRSQNHWTNRMARALSFGWTTRRNCGRIYRNCFWSSNYRDRNFKFNTQNLRNSKIRRINRK